jgi:hypothetical protein
MSIGHGSSGGVGWPLGADGSGVTALAGTIAAPRMTRSSGPGAAWWLRSLLSLLVAVGILALALPAAFGAGARGGGAEPVEVFSSGSLISAEASGGAQLSVAGMVPGQSRSATIQVSNGGDGAAAFSVSAQTADEIAVGGVPLSSTLRLRVETTGAQQLYEGPIGSMPALRLGQIVAGAERAYRFTVTLPASSGNEVTGSSLSASFAWNAVS